MKTIFTLAAALLLSAGVCAQTAPELIFRNPVLINGNAGQNGAKYRFSNVGTIGNTTLDAIVEIKGRSSNDVVLRTIDSTGIGWDKAFQPSLGIPNVGANREWWMEFKMEFVRTGTNDKKKLDSFYVTGLDIDGDNGNLSEWAEMKKAAQLQASPVSSLVGSLINTVLDLLNLDNNGNDYRVNGPITNYTNIDTSATAVMATYKYEKKDAIEFKLGGKTNANGGSPGDVAVRMNSLWFKKFSLAPPALVTLPVDFLSFTALMVNNTNKVEVKWTTAGERNVSYYSVERSMDGKEFSEVGIVMAAGIPVEMQYQFTDNITNSTKANIIYYRVRALDNDGKYKFSATRIIRTGKQETTGIVVATYPNPVSNELRVTIPNNWQGKKVIYEVLNTGGAAAKKTIASNSSQTESINVTDLNPGFYIVKVSCGAETATQKVIKN